MPPVVPPLVLSDRPDSSDRTTGNRRSFLAKAAVGGAALWVAPVVLSKPAAAQSSCPLRVDWSLYNSGAPITIPFASYPLTYSGVKVGLVESVTGLYDATGSYPSGVNATFSRTGQPRSLHVQMASGVGTTGSSITITLTFPGGPVTNPTFTVLDVDEGTYVDRVVVSAAGATSGTGTALGPNVSVSSAAGVITATGLSNVVNTSPNADVAVAFTGVVSSITIVYSRAGSNSTQGIGLSNLNWC